MIQIHISKIFPFTKILIFTHLFLHLSNCHFMVFLTKILYASLPVLHAHPTIMYLIYLFLYMQATEHNIHTKKF